MALEMKTTGYSPSYVRTYAIDRENHPNITVDMVHTGSAGESFSVDLEYDSNDSGYITLASGKTREEAITELGRFMFALDKALMTLLNIEHTIPEPDFRYSKALNSPQDYANDLYEMRGINGPGELSILIGMDMLEHQKIWSTM